MNPNPNIKPVELDIAEKILLDAGDRIRAALKEHGHTNRSFTMVAEMWTTYIKHVFTIRGNIELQAHDVAQLLAVLKNVRSVYGYSEDNFIDQAGYSALAALLQARPILPKDAPDRTPYRTEFPAEVEQATKL